MTASPSVTAANAPGDTEAATLRGFVSAILLPMALFLGQQALSRLF